jgi:cyanophycinase
MTNCFPGSEYQKQAASICNAANQLQQPRGSCMRKFARGFAVLIALFCGALFSSPFAWAACLTAEVEPNNSDTSANVGICSGTAVTGTISSSNDYDWYKLDVTGAGTISISLSHASNVDFDWYLYPATGTYIASASTTNNPETGSKAVTAAGTYYIRVKNYSGTGSYTLNVTGPISGAVGGGGGTFPCALPSGVSLGKVGSTTDKVTTTSGGFVLMGGGADVDAAMQWMINKSGGGDVVVLRSTGTNAYNSYLFGLGTVNSVQTLLIDNTTEGNDACVGETIKHAEMVFIAGGNQQNYIDYFKGKAVGDALNYLINTKKVPIGGTSAGMAIMGQYYHPGGAAEDATVLMNPTSIAIGNNFLNNGLLNNVVTEPHFTQRSRQPRLTSFLASSIYNYGATWQNMRGIACDEATAYALDANGTGKVFGTNACFFVKATGAPEVLAANTALTWNLSGQALNVYRVPGTTSGTNTFNMTTFTGAGGATQFWSVNRGTLAIR